MNAAVASSAIDSPVSKDDRAQQKHQKPCIIWFTGQSGSGKTTIAIALEKRLNAMGKNTYLIDSDHLRQGLSSDLSFKNEDRTENIRRVGEVAKLFVDAGLIVIVALMSPFRADRLAVRNLVKNDEFIEVYMNTPLEVCEQRDVKGLYKKA
jgi:adenylyl-sulfate kinase